MGLRGRPRRALACARARTRAVRGARSPRAGEGMGGVRAGLRAAGERMLELNSRAPAPPGAPDSRAPAGARPRHCIGNAGACAPVRVHVRGPFLPLGAHGSGAELVLAFGQVPRALSPTVLSTGIPGQDSRMLVAWFVPLRHCLWGAGICRTNEMPSLIWNIRGNSSHRGQTAQPQSSGSARLILVHLHLPRCVPL